MWSVLWHWVACIILSSIDEQLLHFTGQNLMAVMWWICLIKIYHIRVVHIIIYTENEFWGNFIFIRTWSPSPPFSLLLFYWGTYFVNSQLHCIFTFVCTSVAFFWTCVHSGVILQAPTAMFSKIGSLTSVVILWHEYLLWITKAWP